MNNQDTIIQATINRLAARIGNRFSKKVFEILMLAKEAPDKIQKEWNDLQEEIIEEANRLQKEEESQKNCTKQTSEGKGSSPKEQIDLLRARVTEISKRLEDNY